MHVQFEYEKDQECTCGLARQLSNDQFHGLFAPKHVSKTEKDDRAPGQQQAKIARQLQGLAPSVSEVQFKRSAII